jgi:hypothetical protein
MPSPGMTATRCVFIEWPYHTVSECEPHYRRGCRFVQFDAGIGRSTDRRRRDRGATIALITAFEPKETAVRERRYWIGVVSRDHVANAVANGFVQLNHGKSQPLARMQPGDGFAFYSPRESYPDGAVLQAFTAIGRIADGDVYEATMP